MCGHACVWYDEVMGQKLGQHFLKNASVAERIASFAVQKPGEKVIEVGPGHGELTRHLLAAGASVTAIEKDRAMITSLEKTFADDIGKGALVIIEGDALERLPAVTKKDKSYTIAGNIPYYITGYLLRIIGELDPRPLRAVLLMQKEVAERMCAGKGEMNILAASVQFWARPNIVMRVRRGSFVPPPKVESAVVVLEPHKKAGIAGKEYFPFVHAAFAHPRKTLFNNLRDAGFDGNKVREIIQKTGLSEDARPHQLGVDDIIHCAVSFKKKYDV